VKYRWPFAVNVDLAMKTIEPNTLMIKGGENNHSLLGRSPTDCPLL